MNASTSLSFPQDKITLSEMYSWFVSNWVNLYIEVLILMNQKERASIEGFSTYQGLPGAPIDWCCLTLFCKLSKKIMFKFLFCFWNWVNAFSDAFLSAFYFHSFRAWDGFRTNCVLMLLYFAFNESLAQFPYI